MKKFAFKAMTTSRILNYAEVDKSMEFKRSQRFFNPQTEEVCSPCFSLLSHYLDKLRDLFDDNKWGTKEDTGTMIDWLDEILDEVGFDEAQDKNSWIMYQIERYLHRIWMRGTAEQRKSVPLDFDMMYDKILGETKAEEPAKPKRTRKSKKVEEPKAEEPKAEEPAKPKRTRKPRAKKEVTEVKEPDIKVRTKPDTKIEKAPTNQSPYGNPNLSTLDVEVAEEDAKQVKILLDVVESLIEALANQDSLHEALLGTMQLIQKRLG